MIATRSLVAAIVLAPLLASCTGQPLAPYHSAEGDAKLARELAGRVAEAPVSCLPYYRSNNLEVVDRDTILFRDGRTVYLQHANGECYPYGGNFGGYTLVTRNVGGGSGLCQGDIARVVNIQTGTLAGSCTFNDFIPYRRPRS